MTIQGLSKNGYSATLCCPHVGILEISQHSIPTCTKLMPSNSWASPPRKPLAITVIFLNRSHGLRSLWRVRPGGKEEILALAAATPGRAGRTSTRHWGWLWRGHSSGCGPPGPRSSRTRGGGGWGGTTTTGDRRHKPRPPPHGGGWGGAFTSRAEGAGHGARAGPRHFLCGERWRRRRSGRRWAVRRDDERQRGAELRRAGNTRSLSALPGRAPAPHLPPPPPLLGRRGRPRVPVLRPGRSG